MERAIRYLAEEQVNLGHEVHVVTSVYGAWDRPREEELNGVHVHRLKSLRLLYPDLTLPKDVPSKLLKRADVVHVHSQNSLFATYIGLEAKGLGATLVVHFMAVDSLSTHPNPIIRLLAPHYSRRNTTLMVESADLHLARSLRDLRILKERYGVEAYYLPDGIPRYYLERLRRDPEEFRRRFGVRGEFVLYVGRIHRLKGPHVLVQALTLLDNVEAVIAGPDDGYLDKTLKLARTLRVIERLHYLGYIDEETKIDAIDASLAVVLPSVTDYVEAYSMLVSEAWARKKPVVGTSVGGLPYRIVSGVNGILVPPNDPVRFGEALKRLRQDRELATRLGLGGYNNIVKLTWERLAKESLRLYSKA
ncbi:MAG: glycosyltransferase family 4 protein [Candidatus Nezhaarchaeota archaeon]|nr:glycosyltransferase family 4 protein [Candidatus Nezhaarchaeota archaeon]